MKQYYIVSFGHKQGPYSLDELASRNLTPETMIWTDGMNDPCPASAIDELRPLLGQQAAAGTSNDNMGSPTFGSGSQQMGGASRQTSDGSSANPFVAPSPTQEVAGVRPPDYLVWSIILIFVFLPGGIGATIYASQVSSLYNNGDYKGAWEASRKARTWVKTSAIIAAVAWGLYILYLIYVWLFVTSTTKVALDSIKYMYGNY